MSDNEPRGAPTALYHPAWQRMVDARLTAVEEDVHAVMRDRAGALKAARELARWTRKDVATGLGIEEKHVEGIESSSYIAVWRARQIAELFTAYNQKPPDFIFPEQE